MKQQRQLLEGKVAVIYGASGAVGRTIARAFAREGATEVFNVSVDLVFD